MLPSPAYYGNACSTAAPLPARSCMFPCSQFVHINLAIRYGEFTVRFKISGPLATETCMFLFALGAHCHSIIAMQFFLIASKVLMNPLGKHKLNQCYICAIDILPLSILSRPDESKSKKGLAELYEVRTVIIYIFISKEIIIEISIKLVYS
jgi:hypothetical protein